MAPLYEVIMMTKVGSSRESTQKLTGLLKSCASTLWDRGAVVADIRPWGQRELAYRIRKQAVNHYYAHYLSMHVYCSPPTLRVLEDSLRTSEHVLRYMTLRQESTPKLDREAREPFRPKPPAIARDLEANPAEAAKWEYRNLVMQRVFEGRPKQELIAEHLARHKMQHAQQMQQNAANDPVLRAALAGPHVSDFRPRDPPTPPTLPESSGSSGGAP